MQQGIGVVEELLPDRLVEAHLVAQLRQPLRGNAALAAAHLNGVARHQTDHHEGDEHQCNECWDGERKALQ